MKLSNIALGGLVGLTAIAGTGLASNVVSADDSVVDDVAFTVPVSCTMTGTGQNSHNANVTNGTYEDDIGTTTLKVLCNDSEGFSIYAIGFTGDQYTGEDHTKLIGVANNQKIATGTATSGSASNWAMKLETDGTATYALTLDNGFGSYSSVPDSYTKVAHKDSGTDVGTSAVGSTLTTTYASFIASNQVADTYSGKVKYTLVHPASEVPLQPQTPTARCINYFANATDAVGTMGCQTATDNASVTLLASNFSRTGYGFAGWSDAFDYKTNENAHFYGPQETITAPAGTTANGLALYAVWVKSAGSLQDTNKVTELCGNASQSIAGTLTTAPTDGTANLSSVSALTDQRDNETYAIAKLADGKCWMIENLRLDNSATLTIANTNKPLNDGTNVTLKHSYSDAETHNTLSASQDPTTTAWCNTNAASCDDQSMLFTGNTTNRKTDSANNDGNIYSYGNYYNWYSATAGNGTYSFSTNNNSVAGDLCPSGWHLPIGGRKANVNVSDFWKLSRATIGADPANFANDYFYYTGTPEGTDASNKMRAYPSNFVYSGYVSGGSVGSRGSYGLFWSSTAYSSDNAYYLYLNSSNVGPGTGYYYKYYGRTVRCVAPGV